MEDMVLAVIAACVAAVLIVVTITCTSIAKNTSNNNRQIRVACIEHGGSVANNTCIAKP